MLTYKLNPLVFELDDVGQFVIGSVGIVVIVIVLLSMTPTVVDQVQGLNTTGWTFTGHDGAIALIGLVPFVWVASILVAAAVGMFALAKGTGVYHGKKR